MNKFQVLGKVKNVKGSIIAPQNSGLRFVLSVNNLAGKPENPLLAIFDKKWKKVREEIKGWYANRTGTYKLGAINTTAVQSDTWIIHMLCQDENLKVNLDGLKLCLKATLKMAQFEKASIHVSNLLVTLIPELPTLLEENFINNNVSVYYYSE